MQKGFRLQENIQIYNMEILKKTLLKEQNSFSALRVLKIESKKLNKQIFKIESNWAVSKHWTVNINQ